MGRVLSPFQDSKEYENAML